MLNEPGTPQHPTDVSHTIRSPQLFLSFKRRVCYFSVVNGSYGKAAVGFGTGNIGGSGEDMAPSVQPLGWCYLLTT